MTIDLTSGEVAALLERLVDVRGPSRTVWGGRSPSYPTLAMEDLLTAVAKLERAAHA